MPSAVLAAAVTGGPRSGIDEIEVVNAKGTAWVEVGHCSSPEGRRIRWSPSTA
jgi:hypothetical protein